MSEREMEKSFDLITRLIQADERERCAKICDEYADQLGVTRNIPEDMLGMIVARKIARLIRGRGK